MDFHWLLPQELRESTEKFNKMLELPLWMSGNIDKLLKFQLEMDSL